jgi:hypothetical protein
MALNKSNVYGRFGGVTRSNYYSPPPSIPYDIKSPPVVFRQQDKDYIEAFKEHANFIGENVSNILLRVNTVSIPDGGDDVDTFVMTTSGKPEDMIEYTSNNNTLTLNTGRIEGGIID